MVFKDGEDGGMLTAIVVDEDDKHTPVAKGIKTEGEVEDINCHLSYDGTMCSRYGVNF